jgi:hypothetical protein
VEEDDGHDGDEDDHEDEQEIALTLEDLNVRLETAGVKDEIG